MRRMAVGLLLICGAVMFFVNPAPAGQGANCSDFTYQEDAQAALGQYPGLDGNDNDGIACESLPSSGGSRPGTAVGGVGSSAAAGTNRVGAAFAATGLTEDMAAAGAVLLVLGGCALRFAPKP